MVYLYSPGRKKVKITISRSICQYKCYITVRIISLLYLLKTFSNLEAQLSCPHPNPTQHANLLPFPRDLKMHLSCYKNITVTARQQELSQLWHLVDFLVTYHLAIISTKSAFFLNSHSLRWKQGEGAYLVKLAGFLCLFIPSVRAEDRRESSEFNCITLTFKKNCKTLNDWFLNFKRFCCVWKWITTSYERGIYSSPFYV